MSIELLLPASPCPASRYTMLFAAAAATAPPTSFLWLLVNYTDHMHEGLWQFL